MSVPEATVRVGRQRRRRSSSTIVAVLVAVAVLVFAGVMTTVLVTVAIWPGEMKLTGPLLCPEARTDVFVVSDTYSARPGETSTTFTMYCMGERGDVEDMGSFRPMAILTAVHTVLIVALALFLGIVFKLLRLVRRADRPPDSSVGPVNPIT